MVKPEVVNQLNAIHELQLLMYLEKLDTWTHNKYTRNILCDSLSIAEITLKVALKTLRVKGFIERLSKGVYKIKKDSIC